jgi:hypothetical protein
LLGCWDLSVSCPDGLRRFDLGEPLKLKNKSLKPKIAVVPSNGACSMPFFQKLQQDAFSLNMFPNQISDPTTITKKGGGGGFVLTFFCSPKFYKIVTGTEKN